MFIKIVLKYNLAIQKWKQNKKITQSWEVTISSLFLLYPSFNIFYKLFVFVFIRYTTTSSSKNVCTHLWLTYIPTHEESSQSTKNPKSVESDNMSKAYRSF